MFIFGPKVGAYTLTPSGSINSNTIDVLGGPRFTRSYFKGMFKDNTGLPANVDEHLYLWRVTEIFKEESERMTGETLTLQPFRLQDGFFAIDTAASDLAIQKQQQMKQSADTPQHSISELGLDKGRETKQWKNA